MATKGKVARQSPACRSVNKVTLRLMTDCGSSLGLFNGYFLVNTFIQNVPHYVGNKQNAGFCIRVEYKRHFKETGFKFHRLRPKDELIPQSWDLGASLNAPLGDFYSILFQFHLIDTNNGLKSSVRSNLRRN